MDVKSVKLALDGYYISVKFKKNGKLYSFTYNIFDTNNDNSDISDLDYEGDGIDDLYEEIDTWVKDNIISHKVIIYKNKIVEY